MTTRIPDNIANGVVAMLEPYYPGLTTQKLNIAVNQELSPRDNSEELLTRREAAIKLRVSLPTVDRMLRDGQISKRRIRGAVRITTTSIQEILDVRHSQSDLTGSKGAQQ